MLTKVDTDRHPGTKFDIVVDAVVKRFRKSIFCLAPEYCVRTMFVCRRSLFTITNPGFDIPGEVCITPYMASEER